MVRRELSDLAGTEQKAGAEQLGISGRRVAGRAPEGHGGREAARRAQSDQKDAELRVARKTPSHLGCADQSWGGGGRRRGDTDRALGSGWGAVLDTQGNHGGTGRGYGCTTGSSKVLLELDMSIPVFQNSKCCTRGAIVGWILNK